MDKLLLTPTEAATALGIGRPKFTSSCRTVSSSRSTSAPAGASPPRHSTPSSSGCAQPAERQPRHPAPHTPQLAGGGVPTGLTAITVGRRREGVAVAARRAAGEGSVHKRKQGGWQGSIDVAIVNGRRRRKTVYGATQREVRDKLAEIRRTPDAGLPVGTRRPMTRRRLPRDVAARHAAHGGAALDRGVLLQPHRQHIIPGLGHHRLAAVHRSKNASPPGPGPTRRSSSPPASARRSSQATSCGRSTRSATGPASRSSAQRQTGLRSLITAVAVGGTKRGPPRPGRPL
jgi:hypothetical protein